MKRRLFLLIIFTLSIFLVTGCNKKEALSANDFVDLIELNEYQTINVLNQFSDYNQVKNAFIAQNKDMTYQIEYYELDTEDNAIQFYEHNRDIFKKEGKLKTNSEIELNNYQKYTQTTKTTYSIVSRINNTIVYANVKIKYKGDIDKIIETLGY